MTDSSINTIKKFGITDCKIAYKSNTEEGFSVKALAKILKTSTKEVRQMIEAGMEVDKTSEDITAMITVRSKKRTAYGQFKKGAQKYLNLKNFEQAKNCIEACEKIESELQALNKCIWAETSLIDSLEK